MRIVPAIIIALAILLASLIVIFLPTLMPQEEAAFDGPAVDSGARIEIEMLRGRVDALEARIDTLQDELRQQGMRLTVAPPTVTEPREGMFNNDGPNTILDSYAQVVLIAARTDVNEGLTVATPNFLENMLGRPREALSDDCEPMTNPNLKAKLVLEQVGPIRVNMLEPAVESLRRVFENVRAADSDLYERINTAGSLCVRRIRGTQASLSTHAFGLAVDLNIDGHLDNFTDGKTQLGLTLLADFFHEEGWIWGAGFRREDSMHFEVSQEQLTTWREEGLL
ncbi:M15 family metallopeptidase [Qingshengfaniella alkalisoli]|uniref:M15 family metallopeptidase n=1 Tax=Qingshengfaniella alkalisoli TaxID=2599296 RepID=A0A5B8J151_9RHOB|nr:M15 family metallopeptidase [Qingshengfaniella alkalisoli]QDY70911.1 M15 family metallopeptidase [Qingshengfaniella alkalisoli]